MKQGQEQRLKPTEPQQTTAADCDGVVFVRDGFRLRVVRVAITAEQAKAARVEGRYHDADALMIGMAQARAAQLIEDAAEDMRARMEGKR